MSGWGKILALYLLVAAAAFGRLALAADRAFSADQINLKGDYLHQPIIAEVYGDLTSPSFPALWMQLAAFRYERQLVVGRDEIRVRSELTQLRAEHRTLMMNRNGTGTMDDSFERSHGSSAWSLSVTTNVARQADLRTQLARTAGKWDAAHKLSMRYRMRQGKKILVRVELPKLRAADLEQVAHR